MFSLNSRIVIASILVLASDLRGQGLVQGALSKDGTHLLTLSERRMLRRKVAIWKIGESKPIATYTVQGLPDGITFHPARNTALISDGSGFGEWDWGKKNDTLKPVFAPDARTKESWQDANNSQFLTVSHDGKMLAIFDTLGNIKAQEIPNGKPKTLAKVRLAGVSRRVSFFPDRVLLCAVDFDAVHVLDPSQEKPLFILKGHRDEISSLDISPDGKHIVTGSLDGTVRVWSVQKKDVVRVLEFGKLEGGTHARFSPDGSRLLCADDNDIWMFQFDQMKQLSKWNGPRGGVTEFFLTKDNETVITLGEDPHPRYWDSTSGKERRSDN